MSQLLKKNASYISLLLQTENKKQAYALLQTATPEQTRALSEIAFNLLRLPLGDEAAGEVRNKRKLLKRLSDKDINTKLKSSLIANHRKLMIDVLHPVTEEILKLLQ